MKYYVIALCIMALALVGLGIVLDDSVGASPISNHYPSPNDYIPPEPAPDGVMPEPNHEPTPIPYGAEDQTSYELGYQAGKLAAYQEIAEMLNLKISELQSVGEVKTKYIDINTYYNITPNRTQFEVRHYEPIPDSWSPP